jgi:CRISPR/Cas system CMR subunit Cmr6 (Cas7 group RAMP superfamily)
MDTYKPNIVYFIRVKPGTKFHFGWVIDKNYRDRWEHARHLSDEEVVDKPLDDAILAFFRDILETLRILDKDITGSTEQEHINSGIELLIRITGELIGFGAKTRLGYGRLK